MIRRCISLLVIVGLLASQLAAIPHAHAAMSTEEQQKHDAVPHFHWPGAEHDHHGHSHDGHDHEHDRPAVLKSESPDAPLPQGANVPEHDATAIYCQAAAAASPSQPSVLELDLLTGLATLAVWQPLAEVGSGGAELARGRPPDKVLDGSSLYLALRHLRI